MNKEIHLNIKEFFVFGICQKIHLTKSYEISTIEITQFAAEVVNKAVNELGMTFFAHLSKDLICQLENDNKDYVKFENNKLKLSKNITPDECVRIFCPNVTSKDLLDILTDKNIGKKVFGNQTVSKTENIK